MWNGREAILRTTPLSRIQGFEHLYRLRHKLGFGFPFELKVKVILVETRAVEKDVNSALDDSPAAREALFPHPE